MKTIIAGSRSLENLRLDQIDKVVKGSGFTITEVVSGAARGIDTLGEWWAERNGIPVVKFPADWRRGRSAGPVRNSQMANYADALVAIWDGVSRGTAHMIQEARAEGLKVHVHTVARCLALRATGGRE